MQIKILAYGTGTAADYYEISGEVITAHIGDTSDTYDLSQLPEGATLTEVSVINGIKPIIAATRINGELQVKLAQQVGAGHWTESDWIDAAIYDPDSVHVKLNTARAFSGIPTVTTRLGKLTLEEYLNGNN